MILIKRDIMLKNEYLRFMNTIEPTASPNVSKMANLILANFDELALLGTQQGQRVRKIVELTVTSWDQMSDEILQLPKDSSKANPLIKRIVSVEIGPFRGFAKEEVLSLDSNIVLIYGPNGTGKTSFCEALEYGLLGSVAEADNKRFKNQDKYFENAHTESFTRPLLLGRNDQDEEIEIEFDQELYQFCFIERNRIDSFSRIAAQLPAKQTELTSTLFGLDAFNDFVKGFSLAIDQKYIDLVGKKAEELRVKERYTDIHVRNRGQYLADLQKIEEEENNLVKTYKDGYTFLQMDEEINGKQGCIGEISRIEAKLQEPIRSKSNLNLDSMNSVRQEIGDAYSEIMINTQELIDNSTQVSYKILYESVRVLQDESADSCPACETPISLATKNPFANAILELEKLEYLARVQDEIQSKKKELNDSLVKLNSIIRLCDNYSDNNFLKEYSKENFSELDIEWFHSLEKVNSSNHVPIVLIEQIIKDQVLEDSKTTQKLEEKRLNSDRLAQVRAISSQIIKLKANRESVSNQLRKANEFISQFEEDNAELIEEVNLEKEVITKNILICECYSSLIIDLNNYKNNLPIELVADLGDMTTKLYNAFNRYDQPEELIGRIDLPLAQDEKLLISFKTTPTKKHDALHVLSEGHIRCLGLAILLAKNIKNNCPLIIFDDPVNSIDDEHRKAIRETLFNDNFFRNKQIILACHGEEFFKDIHQSIGKKAAKETESYIFLRQLGENHIQVTSKHRPKNYILAASDLYSNAEYREALMSSRRALESLCDKAWWHYSNNCHIKDSAISVSRRNPKAPWDLKALAANIRSKIQKSKADIPNKDEIIIGFDLLLGLGEGGSDLHWTYLNKGTHEEEDREEFDHVTVKEIIESLERIDSSLL